MSIQPKQSSLLTRIGGAQTLDALVGALYFKILNDSRLMRFFDSVPVSRLITHQREFLLMALEPSEPVVSAYQRLSKAHAQLIEAQGLSHRHFDAVIENLELTLQDLQVPEPEAREVVAVVAATRGAIFGD